MCDTLTGSEDIMVVAALNAVAEGEWPERFYMEYWGEQSIIIFDFITIIL